MPGDSLFCSRCGTVLPLPGPENYVTCYHPDCKQKVPISVFDGITYSYKIEFNKRKKGNAAKHLEERDNRGPMIDRKCSKCGHDEMSYATYQTRSADEGQTVYYLCPKCDHTETENS